MNTLTKSRRILLLTLYYPPDLSAGAFRTEALANSLSKKIVDGDRIDIFTAYPNRYASYDIHADQYTKHGNISITRARLPQLKMGLITQAFAFLYYSWSALRFVRDKKYDVVIGSSSRLMTAVLCTFISNRKGAYLYLDIRDIFVETFEDLKSSKLWSPIIKLFRMLENWCIRRADKVNLVSEGFRSYYQKFYPNKIFTFFTNGIDQLCMTGTAKNINTNVPTKIVYAGNVGDGQALHNILPDLAYALDGKAVFQVIGDGRQLANLKKSIKLRNLSNIEIISPIAREKLIGYLQSGDILFLHLNNHKAFTRVLPSKIFDYAAMGKPILAGVSGYANEFILNNITGVEIFSPCDVNGAVAAFEKLVISDYDRSEFIDKFSRKKIMDKMADDILALIY